MYFYITADKIGSDQQTGAGHVCHNELFALRNLVAHDMDCADEVKVFSAPEVTYEPFKGDEYVAEKIKPFLGKIKLAHFYSGTFSKCVKILKESGAKVTYTVAAHSIEASKQAFEDMGLTYNFPHLTEPALLAKYIEGYKLADVVIAPSTHSKSVLDGQGCKDIRVIPHGCYLPTEVRPFPAFFTVGYLGATGPDKGLIHLLRAWAKLNYKNALLILAGRDSPDLLPLIRQIGGGNIFCAGWQKTPSDLYNKCTVYIQPSTTEGFGCEVVEALAHGRPVICSEGAGAVDFNQ